ncbi:two-component system, NtrC family, C4-dicarboxylate transport response regulator DctD [Paracoccus aminovorans]|uniref:Two-component system, NtrC family, C4-dicarboxylate transport response regulator DctD n=1 Tax=Paracoccus aminovorans TaxID=34004 RepID=A0A1I3ABL3_9RHOB|nr:sigma-54 dependent transcriptional regulator [Paracoccus aminovorans]CQR83828.1 two-component system transcriptional regulator for C4-dicarboxylate transport [Paracoccus aminovorans]SFH46701.1 two-component system, NtrC family, C4-dicarboxylate transport response regulator DctD [Paracoccus aminovorans]
MTEVPLVRLVDDDPDLLAAQAQALKLAGFRAETFDDPAEALQGLGPDWPGVVLSDVRMPGMDGFQLFQRIHALDPELPVILLTGHGDVPMAVAALKQGVYDFLTKPIGGGPLAAALARAASARALVLENRALRARQGDEPRTEIGLSGASPVMVHLRDSIERLAQLGGDVLITGPEGAGKRTAARAIHRQSPRRARAFTHVQCAALDEARFDAELMGIEAPGTRMARQAGKLEKTHRGTLFLDEIDALAPALQARLQAILQAGEIWPAGAAAPRPLDLRLIASTGRDLAQMVEAGTFRGDLYYRIAAASLQMPALAQRREDVPALFRQFLLQACQRLNLPVTPVTGAVKARLASHDWPGNLAELQQFAESHALGLASFTGDGAEHEPAAGLADLVAEYEAELIRDALRRAEGHATQAMARLKLPRKTFYDKLARHGIRPADFRAGGG